MQLDLRWILSLTSVGDEVGLIEGGEGDFHGNEGQMMLEN